MARLSKFDTEIKQQMDGLEGEPSAKVWAGIREATAAPASNNRVFYRVAAVLIPVGLIAGALIAWNIYNNGDEKSTGSSGISKAPETTQPVQPTPRTQPQPLAIDNQDETVAEEVREENGSEKGAQKQQAPVRKPRRVNPNGDQINLQPELDFQEVVQEEAPRRIQELPVPEIKPLPLPEPTPEQEVIAEETPQDTAPEEAPEEIQGQQGGNSAGEKRQFALSDLRDIDVQDVKRKAGAFLGEFAQNASEKIGLQTDYATEKIDGKQTRKKFSASLGKFSIKRVQRTKK